MLALHPLPDANSAEPSSQLEFGEVTLADGSVISPAGLERAVLQQLQWEQEQEFARAILASAKGSPQRAAIVAQAYDTVCSILAAMADDTTAPLVMGLDPRYVRLVLELLASQVRRGMPQPRLFEIGYGSGKLLAEVRAHGYDVGGVEVSATMRKQAVAMIGKCCADDLLLGEFRRVDLEQLPTPPTLIYWNDVLEHIPPDEAADYLAHIHRLLVPGGQLVTITPNWLLRPSDATSDFCPLRSEARGLHLKEYRLSEVSRLLKQAGFRCIVTPLVAIPASSRWARFVMAGGGGRRAKQWMEPAIDLLPVRLAHILCRGLGMSCTVATK